MSIYMNRTLLSTTGNMIEAQILINAIYTAHTKWLKDGSPQSGDGS